MNWFQQVAQQNVKTSNTQIPNNLKALNLYQLNKISTTKVCTISEYQSNTETNDTLTKVIHKIQSNQIEPEINKAKLKFKNRPTRSKKIPHILGKSKR